MSDGAAIAPMWMPPPDVWAKLDAGARMVTLALVLWRDGRGSCDPTEEELAALLGVHEATIRKHAKKVAEAGVAVRERRRRADNSLGGYRYWLDLEKLGLGGGDRANHAVAPPADSPADPSPENPEATAQPTAQITRSPVDNTGISTGATAQPTAQIARSRARVTREGARARVLSNPIPPSFAFRDDEQRDFMQAVAAACGVGLCRFDECEGLTDSLAIAMDKWFVEGFDADLDIVPTLKRITAHPRAKPVYDFGVDWITKDIRDHRNARLAREARRAEKAAKGDASARKPGRRGAPSELDRLLAKGRAEDTARRANALRSTIARLEAGEGQDFDLPQADRGREGHWRDDAFAAALKRAREELASLAVMEAEGAGDGKA